MTDEERWAKFISEHECCPHPTSRVEDRFGFRTMPSPDQCDCWCHANRWNAMDAAAVEFANAVRLDERNTTKDRVARMLGKVLDYFDRLERQLAERDARIAELEHRLAGERQTPS